MIPRKRPKRSVNSFGPAARRTLAKADVVSGPIRPPPSSSGVQASPRIAFFGDSNAFYLSFPVFYQLESTGRARPSLSHTLPGCGLLRAGDLLAKGRLREPRKKCPRVDQVWTEAIERGRPNVAVVSLGPWEVRDHLLPGEDRYRRSLYTFSKRTAPFAA